MVFQHVDDSGLRGGVDGRTPTPASSGGRLDADAVDTIADDGAAAEAHLEPPPDRQVERVGTGNLVDALQLL